MSKDIIFEELHEYHKQMWDYLSKNPYKSKTNFLELHYDTGDHRINSCCDWEYNDSFYGIIEENAECFACVFADLIFCGKKGNFLCVYCPVTEWREEAVYTGETCPCLEYESPYGRFRLYSDEIGKEEDIEKAAAEVRDMEWSIPEGEEI